jgi:hypothetical protein
VRCSAGLPGTGFRCNVKKETVGGGPDAWVICPDTLIAEGVVYSIGVGDVFLSDLAMIEKYQVNIFAFDPTPVSVA